MKVFVVLLRFRDSGSKPLYAASTFMRADAFIQDWLARIRPRSVSLRDYDRTAFTVQCLDVDGGFAP